MTLLLALSPGSDQLGYFAYAYSLYYGPDGLT